MFSLLLLLLLPSCHASILNVSSTVPDLQSAVNAAKEGDQIRIAAGVYPCSNVVVSSVSNLTISGDPLGGTVFDCSGQMRALTFNSPNTRISLSFMTFRNGYVSDDGGAVAITSSSLVSVVVTNCSFINNTASGEIGGGGLLIMGNSNSVIQVTACNFYFNSAPKKYADGGGGLAILFNNTCTGANVEVIGGEVVGNTAPRGGGTLVQFNQDMKNCSVVVDGGTYQSNNAPGSYGGGIAIFINGDGTESSITLRNGMYTSNTAQLLGGGALVYFNQDMKNCSVVVDGGIYQNNNAGYGGGGVLIYISANGMESSITLKNGIYTNNIALQGGALVYFNQDMKNCSVVVDGGIYQNNNAPGGGGGIQIEIFRNVENSVVVLSHCIFTSNAAARSSGGGTQVIVVGQSSGSTLTLEYLTFKSNVANQGGGVAISIYGGASATTISVIGSSFVSNKASSSGGGGGISVVLYGDSTATNPAIVILEDCNFTSNVAKALGGGALVVLPSPNSLSSHCASCIHNADYKWFPPSDPICQFPHDVLLCSQTLYVNTNYMQNYYIPMQQTAILDIRRTSFLQNRVDGSGGGLAISNGNISFQYVNFTANQASQQGGGVYAAGTADVTFLGPVLFNDNTAATQTALFSNSRGRIIIGKNASITMNSSPPLDFRLDQGQFQANAIVESSGVSVGGVFHLRCPLGFQFVNDSTTRQNISIFESGWPNAMLASSYSGSCIACGAGSYSMQQGFQHIYQDNMSVSIWACQNCSSGANCQHGMDKILALENYWGYMNSEAHTWNFSRCPLGYCCNKTTGCNPMNATESCADGRDNSVPLCGACLDGYSQNLIGDACTKNEDCNDGKWVWPVFCVLVLVWVAILILTSSQRASSNYKKNSGDMSWILPTLMFFFQNAYFLFTVQGGLPHPILEIVGIANFHISSKPKGGSWSTACVIPNLSTTSAAALQLLVPAAIFVTLGLYHLIFKMVMMQMRNQDVRTSRKWLRRTAPAAIKTGMLTYSTLISVCGTLLHCTHVALGQNETLSVLYKAGGASCGSDNTWMPWLFAVFGIVVVPIPLILFSVQVFVRKRGIISHAISAIEEPYKNDRWYWPSVVLLRRLAIAVVYAFDEDPASQGIWFCVLFMFFMLLQLLTTPHKTQRGNAVETCSLVVLTVMSLCTLRTGSYLEANVILGNVDTSEELSSRLDVVQTVIFFAPAVLALVVIVEHRIRKKVGIGGNLLDTVVRKGSEWLKMSQGIELSSMATESSGTEGGLGKCAREAELLRIELAECKAAVGVLKDENGSLRAELRQRREVESTLHMNN